MQNSVYCVKYKHCHQQCICGKAGRRAKLNFLLSMGFCAYVNGSATKSALHKFFSVVGKLKYPSSCSLYNNAA